MDAQASLMELLERIHDPRGAKGKRLPLPALLGLAVVAMLAGIGLLPKNWSSLKGRLRVD